MKKFIISSAKLKKAFSKLGQVIETNPTLPVLKNIYFKITPGQAELITSNTEITIFYRIPCECKGSFEFLATYKLLNSIVNLVGDQPMTIEAGKFVGITTETDSFEIKVAEKLSAFPTLPDVPKKNSFEIDEGILQSLETALPTCSKDIPKLMNVLMELSAGKVTVASADGSFMIYSKEFPCDQASTENLLISQTVISILKGAEKAKVFYHSKSLAFETEDITVIATRSDLKFVNFRSAFPQEWPANLVLQKSDLMRALNKCALSTDQLRTTTISLIYNELAFDADDQFIDVHSIINAEYSGTVSKICVNSDKLLTVIKQIDQHELRLAIHEANRPIVITAVEDPGYKGLIMPIAIQQKTA